MEAAVGEVERGVSYCICEVLERDGRRGKGERR
jgi:hypothetical protein